MLERARCPSPLFEFSLHCAAEWIGAHHNLLLEGAETSTVAVLRLVAPVLPAPVMWKRPGAPFSFPADEIGTLILEDVDGLSPEEQTHLLRWIEARPHTKIVSTTARPLFALVETGRFDVALYYRLNVILLHLDSVLIRPYQNDSRGNRPHGGDGFGVHASPVAGVPTLPVVGHTITSIRQPTSHRRLLLLRPVRPPMDAVEMRA